MGRRRRSKEFKNNSKVIDIDDARSKRLAKRRAEREKEEAKARTTQSSRGKMAIRRQRNRRRLLVVLVFVLVMALIFALTINIISLKREQHEVQQQQQELQEEKSRLAKELKEINDLVNIEEQAREQLKLIKPGETLYIFPDEITNSDKTDESSDEEQ